MCVPYIKLCLLTVVLHSHLAVVGNLLLTVRRLTV